MLIQLFCFKIKKVSKLFHFFILLQYIKRHSSETLYYELLNAKNMKVDARLVSNALR